jgi:hypothetical protein
MRRPDPGDEDLVRRRGVIFIPVIPGRRDSAGPGIQTFSRWVSLDSGLASAARAPE